MAIGNSPKFDPREQSWRLFKQHAARLISNLVLLAAILALLKGYEIRGAVNLKSRVAFTTVTTALILAHGLNFFVSSPPPHLATCMG